jgi:hypothetical protein
MQNTNQDLLEKYLLISKKIDILMNKKTALREKILELPLNYNENGYRFKIQERKGTVDYKLIFDMFLAEDDINVDNFRKEKVKAIIIKEPK